MRETIKHGIAGAIIMLKKIKTFLTIVVIILLFYAIVSFALIGRFGPTHAITMKSSCINCHMDALVDLNDSRHIGRHAVEVGKNQPIVIDNYIILSNSTDINGLCMSCHNLRYKDFGFVDPYITNNGGGANGSGVNVSTINGIVFWNRSWNKSQFVGDQNGTIMVTIGAQEIVPFDIISSVPVAIDATIQLKNFSGLQNSSDLSTNIVQNLYMGESLNLTKQNIYGDYFEVYVRIMGAWNFSSINVTIDDYSMVVVNSTNESYYTLPRDLSTEYLSLTYFHTKSNNTIVRADIVDQDWRNVSVQSITVNSELMTNRIWNTTGYTCNSPDAKCHINQRMTIMGQKDGIGDGRYYSHEAPYAIHTCESCHL